jgi:8-oxo-dGTP pyrophosphatase MutT (NUDIX family)
MKQALLEQLLQEYYPQYSEEKVYKDQMLTFIKYHPNNCFERSLEIGHFTASCWLVNKDDSAALLLHHKKLNDWFQLGGHADGDHDLLAVAVKEAQEESGILNIVPVSGQIFDIDIHMIPANSKDKAHYHYDVRFLLQVVGDQPFVQNHESNELRWIDKNKGDLPTQSWSVVRMFDKWIAIK